MTVYQRHKAFVNPPAPAPAPPAAPAPPFFPWGRPCPSPDKYLSPEKRAALWELDAARAGLADTLAALRRAASLCAIMAAIAALPRPTWADLERRRKAEGLCRDLHGRAARQAQDAERLAVEAWLLGCGPDVPGSGPDLPGAKDAPGAEVRHDH